MSEPHCHEWEYIDSKVVGYDANLDMVEGESSYRCACGEVMSHQVTMIGVFDREPEHKGEWTVLELKVLLRIQGEDETIDRPSLCLELSDLLTQHPRILQADAPLLDTYRNPFRYKDSSSGP